MKIYLWPIFLGFIVDSIASLLLGFVVGFLFFGGNPSGIVFYISALTVGLATVVLGGYVTARQSPSAKFLNAALMGTLSLLLGVALSFFETQAPSWFHLSSFILILPSAVLGAYIYSLLNKKSSNIVQ